MVTAMRVAILLATLWTAVMGADFPEAEISNGTLRVRLHLPDAANGSYQGTRFDWSGDIASLQYKGHEYFGKWYEKHDPKIHDAITGPVEEFRSGGDSSLGYSEVGDGGTFVRIGVGTVRKPAGETAYQMFKTYEIVDPGKWTVTHGKDWITFVHRLTGPRGYAYEYVKTVRLKKGKPEMVLEHALRNTGDKAIETSTYNHNFFVIDNQVVGPDVTVGFGFDPKATRDLKGMAALKGRKLEYSRDLEKGETVMSEIEGFGDSAKDYSFQIESKKAGAGVRIHGDHPIQRILFWSIRSVACPEPYIHLEAEPGKTVKWTVSYEFYTTGG